MRLWPLLLLTIVSPSAAHAKGKKAKPKADPAAAKPADAKPADAAATDAAAPTKPPDTPPVTRTLEAKSVDEKPKAEPAPTATVAVAPTPEPAAPETKRIRAALRVGALVPRTELGTGLAVAAEVGYALPVLDEKLRVQLGFGYSMTPFQGPRIVQGRGLDPHFTQNTQVMPLDLSLVYSQPIGTTGVTVHGGLGLSVLFVEAHFQAFSAMSDQGDITLAPVAQVGGEYGLGPGALVVQASYTEASVNLGTLGPAGQTTISNFLFTAGYAYRF
jgi:hypothetical protein